MKCGLWGERSPHAKEASKQGDKWTDGPDGALELLDPRFLIVGRGIGPWKEEACIQRDEKVKGERICAVVDFLF